MQTESARRHRPDAIRIPDPLYRDIRLVRLKPIYTKCFTLIYTLLNWNVVFSTVRYHLMIK